MTIRQIGASTLLAALLLCLFPPETSSLLKQSGRELDMAIAGLGYFVFYHPETDETRYSRYGRLAIDSTGQLVSTLDGNRFRIDPPIDIPTDYAAIAINADGTVQIRSHDQWIEIGSIQIARFTKEPTFHDPLVLQKRDDDTGPPMLGAPLMSGLGSIQQRWLETRPSLAVQIACRIGFALLAIFLVLPPKKL